MQLSVLIHNHDKWYSELAPWVLYKDQLGFPVTTYRSYEADFFEREHEAILLHLWTDWLNNRRFNTIETMELMCKLTTYRARYPKTKIYLCSDHDNANRNFALPYWRETDRVLYRIPPYDRSKLFPYKDVWAWEYAYNKCYGRPVFEDGPVQFQAAFVGSPSGPPGYRQLVALFTARVGFGFCNENMMAQEEYDKVISGARIVVCPRGWGQSSSRHWDAWRSKKPVLTDVECADFELVPGQVLVPGKHFLTFNKPDEIPDIVSDWARRPDDLREITEAAYKVISEFDCVARLRALFSEVV